jgi:hypothetical protein
VLRAPVEATETSSVKASGKELTWGELLHARGLELGQGDQRLVPIPTSGVYAEAVLGRSNSAEKLDITRFWNWQDSPIPLAPPEIAPVSAAMPTTSLEAKPEALGAPVLSMMTPTALPAPAGLGTALSAIANPNLFRDMSGLAGTQALARTGMSETLMGATDAAQVASANMRTEAQKAVAMGQIAADVAKAAYTHQQSNSKIQDISGEGARINHGADMDRRGVPGPTGLQPYTVASGQAGNGSAQAAGKGGGKVGGAARGYSHETTQRTAGMPVGGFGSSARSPGAATAQPGSSSQGTLPRAANGGASIAPPSDAGSADPADGGSLPPFMTTYRVDDAALLAHLTEALRYAPFIRACADRSQVPVSIIAALGSRVSGWGLDLTPPGPAGIGARSRLGLMQVDPSGAAASTSWTDPATNIALGCNALIQNLGDVLRRFSLADRQVLRAGLAAYDAGIDAVARVIAAGSDAFDSVTTGGNFSDDVLDRAGWFEARGFGRQMAMREVLA